MGHALEVISCQATAPGASGANAAAVAGNSLVVRDTRKPVRILASWGFHQANNGWFRLTSPLMHDAVVGITQSRSNDTAAGPVGGVMVPPQELYAQDTLIANIAGSATAGDIETDSFLVEYDDLPGVDGRYISPDECAKRAVNIYESRFTLTLTGAGGYTGSEAVNADQDQFKANTDYAWVGCNFNLPGSTQGVTTFRMVAPDYGNLGIGMPCNVDMDQAQDFWWHLSKIHGRPLIPVFNSANKALTFISGIGNENAAGSFIGSMRFVQLAPRGRA